MKPIKAILVIFLFTSFSNQSLAQFRFGMQLGNLNATKDKISSLGLGVLFESNNDDKFTIVGSFSYYSASNYQTETVYALESNAKPYAKDIQVNHKTSFLYITSGYKKYLSGNYQSNLGIYGIAGIGLLAKTITPTRVGTRDTNYGDPPRLNQSTTTSLFTFNLATGLDKSVSFGKVFAEASANISTNQSVPFTFNINAGIKINMNKPLE